MQGLIEQIRTRLQRSAYVNEAAISHGVVMPIINALGWDTADPQQVVPEFAISGGRVDFALFGLGHKPAVFIEVKQVGRAVAGDRLDTPIETRSVRPMDTTHRPLHSAGHGVGQPRASNSSSMRSRGFPAPDRSSSARCSIPCWPSTPADPHRHVGEDHLRPSSGTAFRCALGEAV